MKRIFSCSTSQVAIEKWNKHDQKLFEAVEKRDLEKIVALLSKKPVRASKPNPKGQSAFHLAAAKGLTECLNTLLSHGVEINAKNDEGCTALHLAASGCHPDCVKLLLQRGANEESIDFHSRTALHCAASSGCVSSVLLLCDQDEISLDAGDDDGWTPLMIAAQKNHPTICSLLLERGALVNIIDKEKKTALILASEKGNIQAAETLLAHGADVTATDCLGHDALYCADLSRDEALRRLLQGALDKRKKGNETDQRLSRSQESVDAHEESQAPSVPNNIGHDHLALQQDEWRRRYEEEQKKVSRLQGELLKKTHDHEIFAERSRTERDRIQARVHEISGLLTEMTSEQAGRRSGEMRPLSQSSEQPYFLDLLAGQVQAMKEKHQETEKEKQLLQEETMNMARWEAVAEELQEKHQEEVERLQSQVTTAMEEKTSAMRRVTEMEGHLDNMRAVLSQFENRKRIQSSMMEDLNESVFEMTSENERLRQLVRTLEERAEKEEKTETQERALANKCKNAQNVLDSTIRELRQLLRQVRTECASVQKDKAILAESQTLRRNLGDPMQSKLQPGLEPAQALEKCGVSWKKTVTSLELMLTNLEKSNHGLLEKSTQLQRAIAPLQHEGFQAEVEPKVYVNGMASAHQGEHELQKETSNTYPEQFNEAEEPQRKFPKEENELFHEPVLCCQGDKLQQNKGNAYSNQLVDSTGRHQDFILSNDCAAMQEALSRAVELQKEVSDLTLENAGLLKELNDAGEEKEKLQGELHALRRSLQTDFVPMEYVKSQLGELEQNVVLLTDELSTEQEKTRKLVSQLELQRSEIHQLMDSFPPEIVQEEKSKDGKTFSMDVLEELFWNVGTLVRKHNDILQQKLKLGQENEELKHEQTLCISITDHNEKLTSMSNKIDEQATEIEELEQKLSNAKNAVEDLIAVTHKIDSQAAEILELEQKLSNAISVAEDLTSMTHKIGSQATEILELEEKLSNANKAIEDLTSMTHNIDSQATEIQELQEKLSNTNKAIEDLTSMTHKIDSQATEILELEEKLSNANKAIEDLTSMTHKIDSQATEILELEEKLSNANKAIEDLSSMTHKIDSQATEILELEEKLSNANKAIEDLPSMTHKIDSQATEIQELEQKLSNAISAVDGLTLMAHRLDEQAIEIQALEHKLCNATKAVEDFTSMTHKVERQTTEIQELEQKLSSAIKAVEDLSSVTHTIEVQATEIQELKHKLSSATKAAEDFTSMMHKIEKQTTEIQELEQKLSNATKTVENLQKELLVQKTNSVSKDEHSQLISALEKRLTEANVKLESEKQRLGDKCQEITVLTQQLNQASVQIEELKTREERCLQDHEKVRSTLEFQIQTLKGELKAMLDKSELAHREASSWERKAMTRIQTNQDQSSKMIRLEEEVAERLVKSETSQNAVGHLLEKVSQVPSVCQDKERKIAELLAELERYSEEVEDLRSKHAHVQLQLKDTQKQHQEIVATYRTHLLHAAQGFMDEEVHLSLVRIRKMQDSMIS